MNKFKVGDEVILKRNGVFWMTVVSITSAGLYNCRFGSMGGSAGRFMEADLVAYNAVAADDEIFVKTLSDSLGISLYS